MVNHDLLIKLGETEFKPLIDRERVLSDIARNLTSWLNLIRDLVNYGSNLIPRCLTSSDRQLQDAVILTILLRQAVAMLDGVEVLLSNGAVHVAHLQMRALFEAAVYIEWMLLENTEQKAGYYYVHNLRRKRLWLMRTQTGSTEAANFATMMEKATIPISDEKRATFQDHIKDIDIVLAQPRFAALNRDFEDERRKRHLQHDPAWHAPLGPKTVAAIARLVKRSSLYVLLYSGASEVMHSSNYEHHIRIGERTLTLQPIRYLEGFGTVLQFSASIALYLYQKILERYRPGELPNFSRKYIENWQKQYLNLANVKYDEAEWTTV